jgi:nitronate monooxygenase
MRTPLCQRLGIEVPIIQAPMGGAVGPGLAAAVSNAGRLGMLVPWRADFDTVRRTIRETRSSPDARLAST